MQLLEFTRLHLLNRVGLMKIKGTSNTYLLKVLSLRRLQKSISANFPYIALLKTVVGSTSASLQFKV